MPRPQKQPPGYDGRFEQSFKVVPDPYEPGAEATVAFNIRHDIIESLYARRGRDGRRFLDDAQRRSGNRFLGLLEASQSQSSLSCDPTRQPVDGGRRVWGWTDRQANAWRELRRVCGELGRPDYVMLYQIIGLGHPLHDDAAKHNGSRRRVESRRFRSSLTTLAMLWGYQSREPLPIDSGQRRT
jgi:hypothetical protein